MPLLRLASTGPVAARNAYLSPPIDRRRSRHSPLLVLALLSVTLTVLLFGHSAQATVSVRTLINNSWEMVAVPGDPSGYTVGELFGSSLPRLTYASQWVVFRYDTAPGGAYSATSGNSAPIAIEVVAAAYAVVPISPDVPDVPSTISLFENGVLIEDLITTGLDPDTVLQRHLDASEQAFADVNAGIDGYFDDSLLRDGLIGTAVSTLDSVRTLVAVLRQPDNEALCDAIVETTLANGLDELLVSAASGNQSSGTDNLMVNDPVCFAVDGICLLQTALKAEKTIEKAVNVACLAAEGIMAEARGTQSYAITTTVALIGLDKTCSDAAELGGEKIRENVLEAIVELFTERLLRKRLAFRLVGDLLKRLGEERYDAREDFIEKIVDETIGQSVLAENLSAAISRTCDVFDGANGKLIAQADAKNLLQPIDADKGSVTFPGDESALYTCPAAQPAGGAGAYNVFAEKAFCSGPQAEPWSVATPPRVAI